MCVLLLSHICERKDEDNDLIYNDIMLPYLKTSQNNIYKSVYINVCEKKDNKTNIQSLLCIMYPRHVGMKIY